MRMTQQPSVLAVRALAGDPARAAMLVSLLDGRAFSAGELAYASRITAQTARSRLAKLLDGGLLAVETAGRHRYYRRWFSRCAGDRAGRRHLPSADQISIFSANSIASSTSMPRYQTVLLALS